jgi:membrane associated rhomboid family serine protease
MNRIPPITRALLIANVVVYFIQVLTGDLLIGTFALWPTASAQYPGAPSFEIWQLLTYGFLHGSLTHLMFNMLALYMFGGEVERLLGSAHYLQYYLVCVVGAAVAQMVVMGNMNQPPLPTVGASGGVFGLLLAFGMAYPHRKIMLLFRCPRGCSSRFTAHSSCTSASRVRAPAWPTSPTSAAWPRVTPCWSTGAAGPAAERK